MAESLHDVKDAATAVVPFLSDDDLKEVQIERMKWANRRRIAWVFTYATIAFAFLIPTVLVLANKEISDRFLQGTDLLTWIFMGLLTIPGLYFGGTVLEKFSGTGQKQ